MVEILIVDDHVLFRDGLKYLLSRLADKLIIHEAGSAEAGLAVSFQHKALSLILLDLNLPGSNGMDALKAFRQCFPGCPVVVLSGVDDRATVMNTRHLGAKGFISKSASADAMLSSLRLVLAGESCFHVSPSLDAQSEISQPLEKSTLHLTPRQVEVLSRLCQGHSNKLIGRELGMSDNTVRSHLAVVFRELGACSRTEVAFLAHKKGLI